MSSRLQLKIPRATLGNLLAFGLVMLSAFFLLVVVSSLGSLRDSRRAVVAANAEIRIVLDLIDAINHTRTARVWLVQAAALTGSGKFDEGKAAVEVAEQKLQAADASAARYIQVASSATPTEQALAQGYKSTYSAYVERGVRPLISSLRSGDVSTYMSTLRDQTGKLDREFEVALDAALKYRETMGKETATRIQNDFDKNLHFTIGLGLFFLILITVIYFTLRLYVIQPIEVVSGELGQIANRAFVERNISRRKIEVIEVKGMLDSLQMMRSSLRQAITSIADGAEEVSTASSQIAAGTLDLSVRTERQAAQLQAAASSVQDITRKIDETARAADEAHLVVRTAVENAGDGSRKVAEAINNIVAIQLASGRIRDINAVIDGIAFQTNILALNASVEAARAGDQGRGFAVVASEVRNLANRSAEAAKQINEIIQESIGMVDHGVAVVHQTGTAIEKTSAEIARVSALMESIRQATAVQSTNLLSVNLSLNELDTLTQQNAALVEQSSAAAESLRHQAARLASTVGEFDLDQARSGRSPV